MADSEIIRMITQKLDKIEDKVDAVSNKLSEFELSAQTLLTTHEIEIAQLKEKCDKNDAKINAMVIKEEGKSGIVKLLDSNTFNYIFRGLILLLLSLILGADKLKILLPLLGK